MRERNGKPQGEASGARRRHTCARLRLGGRHRCVRLRCSATWTARFRTLCPTGWSSLRWLRSEFRGIEDKRAMNELHNGVLIEAGNFFIIVEVRKCQVPADTRTVQATGNNIVILFPTDSPAGPSTKLYTGRIVYTVAPGELFTPWPPSSDAA
jgi:hypothetical protein